jgi:prolyl-tRNA synthetase
LRSRVRRFPPRAPGEPDPKSGQPLQSRRGIEVGHIFKLGTKYSEKFGAVYTDDQKQSHPWSWAATASASAARCRRHRAEPRCRRHRLAVARAPFQVLVCVLDPQLPEAMELAQAGRRRRAAGAEVLVDDRAERPGVKFKDADLIGIPLRLTIGGKGLKEGIIELKWRTRMW